MIISDLNPYRLFLQYWLLIRNDPDALISAFPTIMIATGLNVLAIVVIDQHDNLLLHVNEVVMHCIVVNVHSNRGGISGSSLP